MLTLSSYVSVARTAAVLGDVVQTGGVKAESCADSKVWKDEWNDGCEWYVENDVGCMWLSDGGQKANCRAACEVCCKGDACPGAPASKTAASAAEKKMKVLAKKADLRAWEVKEQLDTLAKKERQRALQPEAEHAVEA